MARRQSKADPCDNDRMQEQLAKMMRAELIPQLNDQVVLCLRDICRQHGPEAFDEAAERMLLTVSSIVAHVRGRYRLDRMLSKVELVQDEIELQDTAAVPKKWRPK